MGENMYGVCKNIDLNKGRILYGCQQNYYLGDA